MNMKWFYKLVDRFILQMKIDYVDRAIHDLVLLNQNNGEAQLHINNAKDELYRASSILSGMKEKDINGK